MVVENVALLDKSLEYLEAILFAIDLVHCTLQVLLKAGFYGLPVVVGLKSIIPSTRMLQ